MELENTLLAVFSQFNTQEAKFKSFKTFSSGHINNTYLIITDTKPYFVLQKTNGNVFKEAQYVIENKYKITSYLVSKNKKTLQYIETKNKKQFVKDKEGNFWSLCYFLENSQTFLTVKSNKIANEAGKITGDFLASTFDFSDKLHEILPHFHNMTFRFSQFDEALKKATSERKKEAKYWIHFANLHKTEMLALDHAIEKKEIPLRVTHNDTKVSNILFDSNNNGLCLIDLDTVMLGAIHFDYGDALRTICSTAKEDETNLDLVTFNFDYFKSYTQGFLQAIKNKLTPKEIDYLPISPKIITFIMGLRILTDYLNNDIYYKTAYKNHNLDRAKNQFTLVKELQKNKKIIENYIKKLVS